MELDLFHAVLVPLTVVFGQPSYQNFVLLMEGWILAGVHAMTSTALAAGGRFPKHFATYYRFFSRAAWEPDRLGDVPLHMVLPFAPEGSLVAAVDDTIARKSRKHIWGANVHTIHWGLCPMRCALVIIGSYWPSSFASRCTYESLRRLEILAKDWLGLADSSQATQLALTMMQGQQKLTHLLEQDIEAAANGALSPEQLACEWGYSYLELEDMMDLSRWRGWREDDAPVRIAIAIQQAAPLELDIGARLQAARDKNEMCLQAARRSIRASESADGEKRALVFAACAEACRSCFSLKDDRDLVLSQAQAALRWCLLETGRRLRSEGALHEEEDIFLLEPQEILKWLSDLDAAPEAVSRIVHDRICEQERLARYTLPPIERAAGSPIPSDAEVLRGEPASPGVAVGPALVVETIEDIKRLQCGDVLCLKGEKRVGWTTFFPSISALVYETGNWLSHESNLCRELGIPAVVCVGEGIAIIQPGEELRVDGLEGTVTRMEKRVGSDVAARRLNPIVVSGE